MRSRPISTEQEFKLTPGREHSSKIPRNLTQPSLDGSMMAPAGHLSGQLLSNVDARKGVRPGANVFVQHWSVQRCVHALVTVRKLVPYLKNTIIVIKSVALLFEGWITCISVSRLHLLLVRRQGEIFIQTYQNISRIYVHFHFMNIKSDSFAILMP